MQKKINNTATLIAINTIVLYTKMFITMGISFYTVRLLLDALGVEGYGTFTLIAGVIALLSFLNSAMTVSTQRYLSYYQGANDFEMQKRIFDNSLILHLIVGIAVTIMLLSAMPKLLGDILNISLEQRVSAKPLYICMVVSVFFSIVSVPFRASINAHENILTDSVILVFESLMKLLSALLLFYIDEGNRLFSIGLYMAVISVIVFVIYATYCIKNYKECLLKKIKISKSLIKELSSFAGWSLYTNLCYILNTQGFNVLLNLFFATKINAAYSIAFQVSVQIKNLSQSLLRALNPQIMKSEGMTDRERTINLSLLASKIGFFLVSIVSIPCLLVMQNLLNIWLTNVPEFTGIFCTYFLITTMINQLTVGITPAVQAIGDIKIFQLVIGTVALFTLPISYFLLLDGYSATEVLISIIFVEVITTFLKIFLFSKLCDITIGYYIKSIILKMVVPTIVTILIVYYSLNLIQPFYENLFVLVFSSFLYLTLFYIYGLNNKERKIINNLINKFLIKKIG